MTLVLAVSFPKRLKALWSMVASMDYLTRIVLIRAALSDPQAANTRRKASAVKQENDDYSGKSWGMNVFLCFGCQQQLLSRGSLAGFGNA